MLRTPNSSSSNARILFVAGLIVLLAEAGFAEIPAKPLADLPAEHWATGAVQRTARAGVLQGYQGKYRGARPATRYELAVTADRLLDRLEKVAKGGDEAGRREAAREAALVRKEFGPELARLGARVSTLATSVANLIDEEPAGRGRKRGSKTEWSALLQTRLALTDEDPSSSQGRAAATANFFSAAPNAGTQPLSRFAGGPPTGPAGSTRGQARALLTLAQSSVAVDHARDDRYAAHLQLDFDADVEAGFVNGGAVQVNEAFVDLESWLAGGEIRARMGAWALPFSREREPLRPGKRGNRAALRALRLTITPTLWDQNWETIRNIGVGFMHGQSSDVHWLTGICANSGSRLNRDGSLLAWQQVGATGGAAALASPFVAGFGSAIEPKTRPLVNASIARTLAGISLQNGAFGDGRGDAPQGIDSGTGLSLSNQFGFHFWTGGGDETGVTWDAGYFTNGGNVTPGPAEIGTASEWEGVQLNAGWWGWQDWGFMGSLYAARSESAFASGNLAGGARNFAELGLLPNTAASAGAVESASWSILVNHRCGGSDDVTLRFESLSDRGGAARLEARVLTLGWNHAISEESSLQFEFLSPESDSTAAIAGVPTKNTIDVRDDLFQVNYKYRL